MTNEERKALVERLRVNIPYEALRCLDAADQIEADGKRIARLYTILDQAMTDIHDQRKRIAELEAVLIEIRGYSEVNGMMRQRMKRIKRIARAALGETK